MTGFAAMWAVFHEAIEWGGAGFVVLVLAGLLYPRESAMIRYMDMMETFEKARSSVGGANDINDAALVKGLKAVVNLCGVKGDWEASNQTAGERRP